MQTTIKSTFPTFMVTLFVAILGFCAPLGGQNCGPVIISGLDTEYGHRPWDNSHGFITDWASIINTGILTQVTNGSGPTGRILVLGGGKNPWMTPGSSDMVTDFWMQVGTDPALGPPRTIDFANGAAITSVVFNPIIYSMIVIATSQDFGMTGGLTYTGTFPTEHDRVCQRANDLAAFVNGGGGLFGSASNPSSSFGSYAYFNLGTPALAAVPGGGSGSLPTIPSGLGMGIGPIAGPYHYTFASFPTFLSVLSDLPGIGPPPPPRRPCILGGKCVSVPVESKFCCPGKNLVVNGDFEATGNAGMSPTVQYTYNPVVATGATDPGQYNIVTGADAQTINRCWVAEDPSTCLNTSGKFLAVNGQTCGGKKIVWEQSFTVNDWTCYEFCASVKNLKECECDFDVTPNIEVEFSMPGIGNITQLVNASSGACNWINIKKQVCLWGYGSSLTIKILLDESTPGDGNDLALDNIALIAIPNCPPRVFGITTNPVAPTYYTVTATSSPTTSCPGSWWEVCDYDFSLPVPGCVTGSTLASGLANWWSASTNFPEYNGIPPYTPQPNPSFIPGRFAYGRLYRITLGTWGDCDGWGAFTKYIGSSLRTKKVKIFTEEEVKKNPQAVLKALK